MLCWSLVKGTRISDLGAWPSVDGRDRFWHVEDPSVAVVLFGLFRTSPPSTVVNRCSANSGSMPALLQPVQVRLSSFSQLVIVEQSDRVEGYSKTGLQAPFTPPAPAAPPLWILQKSFSSAAKSDLMTRFTRKVVSVEFIERLHID